MPDWLAVGIGGFVGAVSRFQISLWLSVWSTQKFGRIYPFGTFAVNFVGCLFIGILMALAVDRLPGVADDVFHVQLRNDRFDPE
jgi:fluoride exporter